MNKEVTTIIVIGLALLAFTFISNTTPILDFLEEPIIGTGLGTHCNDLDDCQTYCQNNRGNCDNYCNANPQNQLCNQLFGGNQ